MHLKCACSGISPLPQSGHSGNVPNRERHASKFEGSKPWVGADETTFPAESIRTLWPAGNRRTRIYATAREGLRGVDTHRATTTINIASTRAKVDST